MAICKRKQRSLRSVCIGSLNTLITLQNRAIVPPIGDSVDYDESFTTNDTAWAMVETVRGETVFDGTNTERDVTHKFSIRFISGITAETWVELDDIKYDILDTESLDENGQFLVLRAAMRGDKALEVNLS